MTVRELIEQLSQYPETSMVQFAYPYGDHWGTMVTEEIERIDQADVVYSDYHQKDKLVTERNEKYHENDKSKRRVVILSA